MNEVEKNFSEFVRNLKVNSASDCVITTENVFQEANKLNQTIVHSLMDQLVTPSSRIENFEALSKLASLAHEGKACLIFPEHYSNFDLPNLFYLLEKSGQHGLDVADRIVAVAGIKLNEESDFVRAFSEAYSRLVTYPPRAIEKLLEDEESNRNELTRAKAINMASLYKMTRLKHKGHIFLVYPTGTRYRPGDETTKQCLKEMDSYLKTFDYVVFLGMAGNTLRINQGSLGMSNDIPTQDKIVFVASQVFDCNEFRSIIKGNLNGEDRKRAVANLISEKLHELHDTANKIYETEI